MPPIVSAQKLLKRYGTAPILSDLSFTVSERARIGLIGPNGSGKSTLLEILCGRVPPDAGEVAIRQRTRLSYVAQVSEFLPGDTIRSVIAQALDEGAVPAAERAARTSRTLGRAGFADFDTPAAALSGGWRKRLAIAAALIQEPGVLLLDEPTNHLDLAGIEWLEAILQGAPFALVVVSHDRYFLENVVNEVVELDRIYEGGSLRVSGNYSRFLEVKEEALHAQGKRQETLANRVHTEMEWLRRGPKARSTKAKARIGRAHKLIAELASLNWRTRVETAGIDFAATNRQTKQLITLRGVCYGFGDRTLFKDVDFTVTAGMRVALVGPNGSGKTTLLRLLQAEIEPARGEIRRADALRVVYFDQNRPLDPELSLRRALAPDSDAVVYQDRVIHVTSWAARFLFSAEQLDQPVSRLSGGERARVLIAQLMLQPADVLLLDEPTNDLDIPTLEILEESLLEFRGALVLVTHDRYMLDRLSTVVLGLDGLGAIGSFADYSQWDAWQRAQQATGARNADDHPPAATAKPPAPAAKRKLSFSESREFETIEARIARAEDALRASLAALEDPALTSDHVALQQASVDVETSRKAVEHLYARWAELEEKKG